MHQLNFNEKHEKKICLALGFFDSVHQGHKKLIEKVLEMSKIHNSEPSIFTYINNPSDYFGNAYKLIYSFEERLIRLKEEGIENVVYANFNTEYMALKKEDFFYKLINNFYISAIVCGFDFTFGKNAEGKTNHLKQLCDLNGIELKIIDEVLIDNAKVSSSRIRKLLISGEIEKANNLLSKPFFIVGTVEKGRQEGRKLGFPTLNLKINKEKLMPKDGVYLVNAIVKGIKYKGIANLGFQPTFNVYNYVLEVFLLNFNEEIYGETVKIEFFKMIRGVKKFSSLEELKNQINKDKEELK